MISGTLRPAQRVHRIIAPYYTVVSCGRSSSREFPAYTAFIATSWIMGMMSNVVTLSTPRRAEESDGGHLQLLGQAWRRVRNCQTHYRLPHTFFYFWPVSAHESLYSANHPRPLADRPEPPSINPSINWMRSHNGSTIQLSCRRRGGGATNPALPPTGTCVRRSAEHLSQFHTTTRCYRAVRFSKYSS